MGFVWFVVIFVVAFPVCCFLIGAARELWWAVEDRAADLPQNRGQNRDRFGGDSQEPNDGKPLS